jgi:predicted ATPase
LFFQGKLVAAGEHCKQCLDLYDGSLLQAHPPVLDPGLACCSYAALVLWLLGYPKQALQRSREAIKRAQTVQMNRSFSQATALIWSAGLHQFRGKISATRKCAEAALQLSSEKEFALWIALGQILLGWAQVKQGQGAEGIQQIHTALDAYKNTGAELARSYCLALLAEAYGKVGQAEAGITQLQEAFKVVEKNGEHFWEAELYRLQGELLLRRDTDEDTCKAEASMRQALAVARRQKAKSLELRAAVSLSRLWQRQGKRKAAQQPLKRVYGQFPERGDTVDLQDAKKLLKTLGIKW